MTAKKFYFARGKHRIEDVDITVDQIMQLLSAGMNVEYISDHFPELTPDDINACIAYALKNIQ